MDKLKEFIDQNRDQFDEDFLPEGHLERFERKLSKQQPHAIRRYILPIIASVAAACLLLFLLIPKGQVEEKSFYICEADEEMDGLREYYNMRVYDVKEQIKNVYESNPSEVSLHVVEEAEKVAQTVHQFEEYVLPTLPCTNDGLSVITQQYESNLESLNYMLEKIETIAKDDIN